MKSPYNMIIRPIVTEKTMMQKDKSNQVSFEVALGANKLEVKQAVEKIFDVTVESVQMIRVRGKIKRLGRYSGKRADWKKAVVTLKPGDKIDYFEGA
ncbi:50S ribosomal protein L23 [bacterium]|nr:50S ribosomal protein L23 [candidate division CSSED10-310 bacterium]